MAPVAILLLPREPFRLNDLKKYGTFLGVHMARLYSRFNATAHDDPVHGHFDRDPDHGGFDFPDQVSDPLHSFHYRGKPAWETGPERDERLHGEDSDRRRDPQTLYNAVEGIGALMERLAAVLPAAANEDVAKLTAEVEALRAQLAQAQAPSGDTDDDDEDDSDSDSGETAAAKKPAPRRKAATAA
jgi:hypothetical protein